MNKTISLIFMTALLFSLLMSPALAGGGSGNITGDSGGMGSGSSTCYWNGGDDGVRVTVITSDGTPVSTPIDYSNINVSCIQAHFGRFGKLSYIAGTQLAPSTDTYSARKPENAMPRIISTGSYKASIERIKKYWCAEPAANMIAKDTGIDYEKLVSGEYKLFIEPIAYFHYCGVMYAMTATEAAMYNKLANGALRASMVSLTSKNLPLAIYLKVPDLGFPAYSGSNNAQSDDVIISSLGLGIVSFVLEVEDDTPTANYEYRTDTDVITSILLANRGEFGITPDDYCSVRFEILGETYSKQFICPAGEQQLVWIKWHTPSTPQLIKIGVTGRGFNMNTSITANVVEFMEKEPPDPKYGDTNKGFALEKTPDYGSSTEASWQQWCAFYMDGCWQFYKETYSVKLRTEFELVPDSRVQTAVADGDDWEMKSGYGVDANCKTKLETTGPVDFKKDYTQVQTEVATFSDFGFKTYNRMLEPERKYNTSTVWHFKENINSYYLCPVHFTPLWYPDETDYVVALSIFDAWTPVGMLYTTASDSILIDGNVYDDWYIRLMK